MVWQERLCPNLGNSKGQQQQLCPTYSRFYLVVVQYEAKLNNSEILRFIRELCPAGQRPSRKAYNFQLASPEVRWACLNCNHMTLNERANHIDLCCTNGVRAQWRESLWYAYLWDPGDLIFCDCLRVCQLPLCVDGWRNTDDKARYFLGSIPTGYDASFFHWWWYFSTSMSCFLWSL